MVFEFASIWKRAGAYAIDTVIVIILMYTLIWLNFFENIILSTIFICFILLIPLLYFIIFETITGQTLGKKLMKIKVIGIEKTNPGILRIFLRNILRIIDTLPFFYILGIILIIFTKNKQRLGDLAGKTIVIKA